MKTVNKWFALCVVLTAPLLYGIDIFIINIAIPTIKRNLPASHLFSDHSVAHVIETTSFLQIEKSNLT